MDPAFAQCWKSIEKSVRAKARKWGGIQPAVMDSDDLMQEAMLAAHLAWGEVSSTENPAGLVYTVAHRAMVSAIRKTSGRSGGRRRYFQDLDDPAALAVEESHGRPDSWYAAERLLDYLIESCDGKLHHKLVLERLFEGFTPKEIAAEIGVSESRVSQIAKDFKRLVLRETNHRVVVELPAEKSCGEITSTELEALRAKINDELTNIERWVP